MNVDEELDVSLFIGDFASFIRWEWNCYGKVSVYKNLKDDRDREWVDFNGMKFPTEETDKGGYFYKVQYGGTWYYF